MAVKDTVDALIVTLKNLFRKPITVQYPKVKRPKPERFRGLFALTTDPETGQENCIGCKLCENICPSHVITVIPEKREGRGWAKEFYLDLGPCIFCEMCVQVCPTDAIVMVKTNEIIFLDRKSLVLDKSQLMANEKKYQLNPITGSVLRTMQSPPKPKPRPSPVQPKPSPHQKENQKKEDNKENKK